MANNYVSIAGKLTKFEIRKAGSEHKIAELTIAAYNGQDADCPVYIQAKQWNPTSKTKKMLKRIEGEGRVCATGRLRMDTWENDDDEKQFKLYLLADDRDGILEADEAEEYDENSDGKKGGDKKGGGGKKSRGKKNTQKKKGKGKGKKKRREEEEDDEDEDDDGDDDDDDDWDEDD